MTEPCEDCVRATLGPWLCYSAGCAECAKRMAGVMEEATAAEPSETEQADPT